MRNSDPGLGTLRRLGLFLLPLALLWTVLEVGMTRVVDLYSAKRSRCQALAGELDTIVVGSSNAFLDIAPSQLSGSVYNLATPSATHYYDNRIAQMEMPRLPHLKRIIVGVGYFSLFTQLHDSIDNWRQFYFQQDWGILPARRAEAWNIKSWSRVALFSPESSINALFKGFRVNRGKEVDGRGWCQFQSPGSSGLTGQDADVTLARHHASMDPASFPDNLGYLQDLITAAERRHIEVVLVTLPVWDTYRARIRPGIWNQGRAAIAALASRPGVRQLDFFHEPRLGAADFEDCDHLNPAGALRFSRMLNAAL